MRALVQVFRSPDGSEYILVPFAFNVELGVGHVMCGELVYFAEQEFLDRGYQSVDQLIRANYTRDRFEKAGLDNLPESRRDEIIDRYTALALIHRPDDPYIVVRLPSSDREVVKIPYPLDKNSFCDLLLPAFDHDEEYPFSDQPLGPM